MGGTRNKVLTLQSTISNEMWEYDALRKQIMLTEEYLWEN